MNMFKFLEKTTEVIGWLQIFASPAILGSGIGAIIYFSNPSLANLVIALLISLGGIVFGIVWANRRWKKKGTVWFMSRINASPELDDENIGKKNNNE